MSSTALAHGVPWDVAPKQRPHVGPTSEPCVSFIAAVARVETD